MQTIRIVSLAVFVMTTALSAAAQERPAAAAPMASASMPQDCAKPMARHDHTVEKGSPRAQSASPCAPSAAASAPKAKLRHDHAKFHKNQ